MYLWNTLRIHQNNPIKIFVDNETFEDIFTELYKAFLIKQFHWMPLQIIDKPNIGQGIKALYFVILTFLKSVTRRSPQNKIFWQISQRFPKRTYDRVLFCNNTSLEVQFYQLTDSITGVFQRIFRNFQNNYLAGSPKIIDFYKVLPIDVQSN